MFIVLLSFWWIISLWQYKMCIFKSKTLHEPNESPYYPLTISVNNCGRSFNTIDDSYVRIWIPNKVKNECESNKKRCLVQHELCEYKCRLHENVYNSKRKWNFDVRG